MKACIGAMVNQIRLWFFMHSTVYHLGLCEPSSLSTKGLHTFTLFKFPLTLSLCVSLSLSLPRHRNNISFFHNNIGGVLVVIFATAVGTFQSLRDIWSCYLRHTKTKFLLLLFFFILHRQQQQQHVWSWKSNWLKNSSARHMQCCAGDSI